MKQNKKIIVVWHYMANYGFSEVEAENATEAIRGHLFFARKDIELIAFENNKENSAYKRVGEVDVVNPVPKTSAITDYFKEGEVK